MSRLDSAELQLEARITFAVIIRVASSTRWSATAKTIVATIRTRTTVTRALDHHSAALPVNGSVQESPTGALT